MMIPISTVSADASSGTAGATPSSAATSPIRSAAVAEAAVAALLAACLIVPLGVVLVRRSRRGPDASGGRERARRQERELADACAANEPRRAYAAFREWLRTSAPTLSPSSRAFAEVAPRLAAELARLESGLYSREPGEDGWNGEALARAFAAERRGLRRLARGLPGREETPSLPTLYPA